MLYSYKNQYPQELPKRIRLSDSSTRTDSSVFTAEEISMAGYVAVSTAPTYNNRTHKISWDGFDWNVVGLTTSEISSQLEHQWMIVRSERDESIRNVEWRIMRHQSEVRLGITTTTDNISNLDTYVQALRDITKQSDPYNITWPNIVV